MNFIFTTFLYFIVVPLFIIWLLICFLISLIGLILFKKKIEINLDRVKKRETICSVLKDKKFLSEEEYEFETVDVASQYDELTFRGYLFVLKPIIFLLKNSSFTDEFVFYIVKKWMKLHEYKREQNSMPKSFFSLLMKLCVVLAGYVGQVLYRLKL